MCMCVCFVCFILYVHVSGAYVQVSLQVRRGYQIPQGQSYRELSLLMEVLEKQYALLTAKPSLLC